jgi:transcriptional regulator with XRE-family HTH domain
MSTATKTRKPAKRRPVNIVADWREVMGFTQRDAAEALHCSREALDGWEKGRHELPYYIALAMNALAMGMQPYGYPNK